MAPIAAEEVIPATLVVRVFSHRLPCLGEIVDCWSFVSDGLFATGQKEIVFTVKREVGDRDLDYPRQLLQIFCLVHFLALQQRTVDLGGFSSLASESGLIGRPDFRGVVYSTPQLLDGIEVTGPFLTAILLTRDEFQVSQQYGIVRMTTLLGKTYRFFPCAPWADRKRQQVATLEGQESSILAKVRKMTVLGPVVYLTGRTVSIDQVGMTHGLPERQLQFANQRVILDLPVSAHGRINELLTEVPEGAPFAILSTPDPLADALLYWSPGSSEPHSISAESSRGQRIGGNFLLLVPDQAENGVTVCEDGFAVTTTNAMWASIRQSVAAGTNLQVPAKDDGLGFEIVWHRDSVTPKAGDGRQVI